MSAAPYVQLSITEGPVIIPSLDGAGVNATHCLWNGADASEYFPPGVGASGANYVVNLKKNVTQADDVRPVEDELTKALFMLVEAWPFSGGSYMVIESRELICSPRFESNAIAIEHQLLERNGLKKFTAASGFPLEICATYARPPLPLAIQIAKLMRENVPAKKLLHYYYQSRIDRTRGTGVEASSWCINLYKVRDVLSKQYGSEKDVERALGGAPGWSNFGKLLNNNDLRHAEISGTSPLLAQEDINLLYDTARTWISSYLKMKGLPVN
jgi:hypothetical protein